MFNRGAAQSIAANTITALTFDTGVGAFATVASADTTAITFTVAGTYLLLPSAWASSGPTPSLKVTLNGNEIGIPACFITPAVGDYLHVYALASSATTLQTWNAGILILKLG